ncbi:hypothetical protein Poli38472_012070 [Pythium oligandrum]|uniref:Ubiquitin-like domain-containing protein n=1 Tax=Pythium oligandrum TaxID=41045 RepID=A0A8K1CNZ5_PYTOL|nr:hypothetical protein Poli38472_012070 [Pythium oligandrum]|eukprot:TMW66954.1 hypothetical protein Poli38472_012070 [Pythium oligandrum]
MTSTTADRDVRILIKNVYAPSEPQTFVLADSLTIRTVKEMLQQAVTGNPEPKHQKLIFGGKICDDEQPLRRILSGQTQAQDGSEDMTYVFHLMVTSVVPRSRPSTPSARAHSEPPTPRVVPSTVEPPRAVTPPANVEAAQTPTSAFTFPPVQTSTHAAAPAANPMAQQHQQQFYMQSMLMHQQAMILSQIQYLQQLQAHYAAHPPQQTPAQPAQPAAHAPFGQFAYGMGMHHPAMFGHANHIPGHPAAPAAAAAATTPGTNPVDAQQRPVGPIAQAFREIWPLCDIRLAMKMAFMLFIIGQDTPQDRLIVLALMSFGAYLHITGILAKVYEVYQRLNGQAEAAPAENANGRGEAAQNNPNGAQNAQSGRQGLASLTRHLRIAADRGFLQDVRYFFTGFVLSLAPAWHPQPMNGDGENAALVGQDGNALTSVDAVSVDIEDVVALRDAVKDKYKDSHLAGIAPSDLTVFAVTQEGKQRLEEDSPIESYGATKKDVLIVQVPQRAVAMDVRGNLNRVQVQFATGELNHLLNKDPGKLVWIRYLLGLVYYYIYTERLERTEHVCSLVEGLDLSTDTTGAVREMSQDRSLSPGEALALPRYLLKVQYTSDFDVLKMAK